MIKDKGTGAEPLATIHGNVTEDRTLRGNKWIRYSFGFGPHPKSFDCSRCALT